VYYKFCGFIALLRLTPAIEAGMIDHVWDLGELLA
jgi:hypothetical protein